MRTPFATLLIAATFVWRADAFSASRQAHVYRSALPKLAVLAASQVEELESVTKTNHECSKGKGWQDDGFVFGLEGSGIERPKGKMAMTVVEGDSLETKPSQVAIVAGTLIGHAGILAFAFKQILEQSGGNVALSCFQSFAVFILSWISADLGSGILHWSVDNYGNGRTPIMGTIIAAFQGHHSAPWTITERGFCNNVYKLCTPFGMAPMVLLALTDVGPRTLLFASSFCVFEILSQEFHKWSHMVETPSWINMLQRYGLAVSRKAHGRHHNAPFEGNYSIVSGITNNVLDHGGFFRRLEHAIYNINGIEPNAWKLDPHLRERTLRGDYGLSRKNRVKG